MSDTFNAHLTWTGGALRAAGAVDTATFSRDLEVRFGELMVPMSSAPAFHGDPSRVNPEQMFVAAISACQALTFLALAARKLIPVVAYDDDAEGTLAAQGGKLRMTTVVLKPRITLEGIPEDVAAGDVLARARDLVRRAHDACFIANSVSAMVLIEPSFSFQEAGAAA